MRVLVVGQGGREHALAWKIKQSKRVKELFCAPGNGGTTQIAINIPIKQEDIDSLCNFCKKEKIDLTLVGPEAPLAIGIVDKFKENGLKIFGPDKKSAQLESSKVFTKELAKTEGISTASFEIFDNPRKAKDFVKSKDAPIVIKADGLAQGKGVIIVNTVDEALCAIDKIMIEKEFGTSGDRIIIEERLEGEEASIIVISDGENIVPLASSQDHKRIFDGDKGPNTGGMGAYSPAPVVTDKVFDTTISKIILPAIKGMKKRGLPYKGVLYAGIMIKNEEPKLLEFNVRFGDPEMQAIFPRLNSDLLDLIELAMEGSVKGYKLDWDKRACVCVVIASGGYPGKYEKEKEISGINKASNLKDTIVFHAGTKTIKATPGVARHISSDATPGVEKVVTDGGRVLNIASLGTNVKEAVDNAYKACRLIKFEGMHYRRDIGCRALNRKENTLRCSC